MKLRGLFATAATAAVLASATVAAASVPPPPARLGLPTSEEPPPTGTALTSPVPPNTSTVSLDDPARWASLRGRRAFLWSLGGTLSPLVLATAFSVATGTGRDEHPSRWKVRTLGGLLGLGLTWGPSLGFYDGEMPAYATLAGLARTAVVASAVYADRNASFPVRAMLAVGAAAAWDIVDLATVRIRVRNHLTGEARRWVPLALPVEGGGHGLVLGLGGTY